MRKLIMGLAVSSMILTACNKEPELSFTPSATEVAVGESVTFTNGADVKKAYNITWSFGDGGSASTWNASHAYSEPGEYTVTMSGTSKKGNKAASTTSVITVTKSDYDNLEDEWKEQTLASDAWWKKAMGTWKFSAGSYVETDCTNGSGARSYQGNAASKTMTFTIVEGSDHAGSSYYMNDNSEKNGWTFEYIDDTHVRIGGFMMNYTPTTGGNIHTAFYMTDGIYTYTNTGSSITLERVEEDEESFTDGTTTKYCVDTETYKITLTK